ncbi:MAG: amidohydrolase [Acetobacteraceae bacterium]|nr:amidohydrolase [Acetobacteraceae bacterium]
MAQGIAGGIDCDVHPAIPGMAALLPYLDPYWQEQVAVRGIDGLDLSSFPPQMAAHGRADWRDKGEKPGTSLARLRADALDGFGTQLAICNPLYGVLAIYNEHFAAALARAINAWLAAEWLDRESRLRGSITVATQNPELAVDEIERCATDPRFVQVLLLNQGDTPLGNRRFWPIYAAAERHGLSIGIHAGSIFRHATTSNGWPSYHLEDYAAHAQSFQSNLLSLVHEGAFTRHPGLIFVMIESGFTWLPTFLWRANKTWRGVRAEVPWVDRPPSEYIRDHVRFTLQPTDAPPTGADMARLLAMIGRDNMLLFSTDYPHWQFDGDNVWPDGFSNALKRRVLRDNPMNAYPRLKEALQ